jgi:hypothetical protein
MSFGQSVFSAGFNQKTIKDLFVKANHVYPQWGRHGKTLEDSIGQSIEAGLMSMTCGAGWPHCQAARACGSTCQPPLQRSVLHRLKDQIYAAVLSRFDLRVQD